MGKPDLYLTLLNERIKEAEAKLKNTASINHIGRIELASELYGLGVALRLYKTVQENQT